MIFRCVDIWTQAEEDGCSLLAIPANSTLDSRGHLVMGRGAALQLKQREPHIPALAGARITHTCGDNGRYGFMPITARHALFQSKTDWRHPSNIDLIAFSIGGLVRWLCDNHPSRRVGLVMPGVGNGGITFEEVLPLLASLSDRVVVYWQPGRH